jgi:cytidylate kinase
MISMEQIVNRQLERWSLEARARQEALEGGEDVTPEIVPPWVCISRQFGSGGGEIARRLAARLNYRLFDQELMDAIASEFDHRRASLELLDEKVQSSISLYIDGLLHGETMNKSEYLRHLMEVVLAIGHHGAAVILGRGANFILDPQDGVSVRIVAPFEHRIQAVAARFSLAETEAAERIEEVDRDRNGYVKTYFKREADDPTGYDLVINAAQITVETALRLIEHALREKVQRPGGGLSAGTR